MWLFPVCMLLCSRLLHSKGFATILTFYLHQKHPASYDLAQTNCQSALRVQHQAQKRNG